MSGSVSIWLPSIRTGMNYNKHEGQIQQVAGDNITASRGAAFGGFGANALGAWVADGWYAGYIGFGYLTGLGTERIGRYTYGKTPSVMVQLEMEYADGSRETIVTDQSWKVTGSGPIQWADIMMGERYDARQEMPGWDVPGFNELGWQPVILAAQNGSTKAMFFQHAAPPVDGKFTEQGTEVELGFKRPLKLEA